MHVEIGYRKICHLVNCIQLVTMRLSSNLRTGLYFDKFYHWRAVMFIPEKDSGLIPQILTKVFDSCVNGVTLSDPDLEDMPLVYANKAFETVTGYSNEETVGRNCRFLQGTDHDQPELMQLREAIKNRQEIGVTLRNYKKNGELFYNHLEMTPLFDPHGNLLYYLGVQFDITNQIRAAEEIKSLTTRLNKLENK